MWLPALSITFVSYTVGENGGAMRLRRPWSCRRLGTRKICIRDQVEASSISSAVDAVGGFLQIFVPRRRRLDSPTQCPPCPSSTSSRRRERWYDFKSCPLAVGSRKIGRRRLRFAQKHGQETTSGGCWFAVRLIHVNSSTRLGGGCGSGTKNSATLWSSGTLLQSSSSLLAW